MDETEQDQSTEPSGERTDGQSAEILQSDLTYEEAYARLSEVLETLETGDLSLDESLSLYELGAALAAFCERKLDAAELRIRQWQPQGDPTPFTGWQDDE